MITPEPPPPRDLPSIATLIRSTFVAAAIAGALVVTVILPAEYAIDPTGLGRRLRLTQMGELKLALEREARLHAEAPPAIVALPAPGAPPMTSSHVTRVLLAPNQGKEVKLVMRKGAAVTYAWSTDQGVVNFDTHADGDQARGDAYHSYRKASDTGADEGTLTAVFDGLHGWYWRNRSSQIIVVTLRTDGDYQELRELR